MNDKPTYRYEATYGGPQEVELSISAYTLNDNLYVGMREVEPDGSTYHYADLTVNIPSAPALEPFCAALDIEHLGQLDAMNFLTENGLAKHAGEHLPSGYMVFPVFEFVPEKLAEADPKGFKDYLKIIGLDDRQIEENSVEDLASMAKARFLEKTAESEELGAGSQGNAIDFPLDDEDGAESPASKLGAAMLDLEAFMQYCVERGLDPHETEKIPVDLPDTGKPFLDYDTSYGDTEKVNLEVATYQDNDNLYVGLSFYDPELEGMDFYGDVTVNVISLDPWVAAIDTNNNNVEKITAFLVDNGIAEPTGGALPSGYCMYPIFRFFPEKLAELAPRGFEQHCRDAGIKFESQGREAGAPERESLDDLKNQAKDRAADKNSERPEQTKTDRSYDMEL